jgi:hypothetical protein
MKQQAALLALLALAGCSTPYYTKPGAGPEEFHMENGQCEAYARSAPSSSEKRKIYDACMRGKGWYRTKNPN